jgi:hypothetical protein
MTFTELEAELVAKHRSSLAETARVWERQAPPEQSNGVRRAFDEIIEKFAVAMERNAATTALEQS